MYTQIVDVPEEFVSFVHFTNKNGKRTGGVGLIRWVRCQLDNRVFEVQTTSDREVYVKNIDGIWVEVKSYD
jgi:hypothetical protein